MSGVPDETRQEIAEATLRMLRTTRRPGATPGEAVAAGALLCLDLVEAVGARVIGPDGTDLTASMRRDWEAEARGARVLGEVDQWRAQP